MDDEAIVIDVNGRIVAPKMPRKNLVMKLYLEVQDT